MQTDQKTGGPAQAERAMTGEEVLTCAINIGEQLLDERGGDQPCGGYDPEDLQCLRDPAEPYFLDRVVYHRDAGDKERKWITQTRTNFKLRDGYVEALDRLNDLSRRICATQPSFAVIDQEYEKILKGPTYSPAVQCGIYAMTAGAFAIFFWRKSVGWICVPVCRGADPRDLICALRDQAEGNLLQYPLLSDLRYGMYSCLLMSGSDSMSEMIMIGNIMLLIPGVLMTNSFRDFISGDMISGLLHFSEAMITAVCVAAGFILSKILLGGML